MLNAVNPLCHFKIKGVPPRLQAAGKLLPVFMGILETRYDKKDEWFNYTMLVIFLFSEIL